MKKILVVDDEPDLVDLIKKRLEVSGFKVETAADAATALVKIETNRPDLITLDILMPGIIGDNDKYGASLCDILKTDEHYKHIPIIIISALDRNTNPVVQEMVRKADAYLTKPFDSEVLIKEIKRLCKV